MNENTTSWSNYVFAFFGGAVIGAATILLTTPRAGRDVRELLTNVPGAVKSAGTAAQKAFLRRV